MVIEISQGVEKVICHHLNNMQQHLASSGETDK